MKLASVSRVARESESFKSSSGKTQTVMMAFYFNFSTRGRQATPLLRRHPPTKLVHQRLVPVPPSLYSLQHSRANCVKSHASSPVYPIYVRGVMQIKKLKVHPQKSTRSLPLFPLLFFLPFPFSFCFFYPSSRHKSTSFIPCHRPARGALRPPTRIDARMLGSHERRQINRGLSRARPDSL